MYRIENGCKVFSGDNRAGELKVPLLTTGYGWEEVKPGQSVGFSQGWALNYLLHKYHPSKMEMGWIETEEGTMQAYRITCGNIVVVYADKGDSLVQYR